MPLEEEMVARAGAGALVDRGGGPFNLAEMQAWGEMRTVRAEVFRHLLAGAQWLVDAKGVRLPGVRIKGFLDLEAVAVRCPLLLDCCYLDSDVPACLDHAAVSRVRLTGCHLAGLAGTMLVARELDLSGSNLTGPLTLVGAEIAGQLVCSGAQLNGIDSGSNALVADGMTTGRDVLLDGGFTAAGAVRLVEAEIAGRLVCNGARLAGKDGDGNALVADGIKTGGSVFLGDVRAGEGFTAAGAVRLPLAKIGGQLTCRGAQLNGSDSGGRALFADRMKTGGHAFLSEGFTAAGAVWLPGAEIAGMLSLKEAHLTGADKDGNCLVADWVKVGSDLFIDNGFTASGTVSLASAHVEASVGLMPAALASENEVALSAARAKISGTLKWAPTAQISGQVNLEGAAVGQLDDDWSGERLNGYWPAHGRLHLDGFTYGRFGGSPPATVEQRLAWIRSQYQPHGGNSPADFATQPYEQLAAAYRQAGQDTQARKVAIARRADLRRYGNLSPYRWFGNWLLDKTIKYGYQTWRAGVGLAAVFMAVWVLSFLAQQHHLMMPVGDIEGLHPVPSAARCTSSYPCFYPAGYAVDTVIPIINVHQADYWGPDGHTPWGTAWVTATWIATGLGWALATLLVAGYTGLVRQD